MRVLRTVLLLLVFFANTSILAYSQSDSSSIGLRLNAQAFFDNKEFTGNFKKGYTLPGFLAQPTVDYHTDNFSISAGFNMLYLAGADSLNRFVPVVSLKYDINPDFYVLVGSMDNSTHNLPEQLYKPERVFMDLPNLGIELKLNRPKIMANLWMNWERYIELGSLFQEEFMVGLVLNYRQNPSEIPNGLYANLNQIATHAGGQIDATDLPVTTISNTGLSLGYAIPVLTHSAISAEVSGYYALDASPNPHLTYKNGNALQGKLIFENKKSRIEAGYWKSNSFFNPRGEELYSSISTLDSSFNLVNRSLLTAAYTFTHSSKTGFELSLKAGLYADLGKGGSLEYYYTLIMKFNNKLFTRKNFN